MRLRAIAVCLTLLGATVISAAGDLLSWKRTFGGEKDDILVSAAVLPDGGYVVAGQTKSKGAGGLDFWVVRFDREGNIVWDKTFGGPDEDAPVRKALAAFPDGGFALAGAMLSKGAGVWVGRLDRDGNVLWEKSFEGGKGDFGTAIAAMADGGLAVVSTSGSDGPGAGYGRVLRLDRDGGIQWEKAFPAQATPRELVAVAALADGGLLVGGKAKGETGGGFDAWAVRLDAEGEIVWDKTYPGPNDEEVDTIVALPDSGFVIAGGTKDGDQGSGMAWRLDRDGNLLWQKSFGGPRGFVVGSALLPDGGFALAGVTGTSVGKDKGGSVWRLDADGRLLWQQTIAGPNPGFATAIDRFPDGSFLVAGVSEVNGQMDGAIAILPPSPAAPAVTIENAAPPATAEKESARAATEEQECTKYLPSVGKTVTVPCEQVPSSASAAPIPPAPPSAPAAPPTPTAPAAKVDNKTAELEPPRPAKSQDGPQDAAALDAKLQQLAAWTVAKREFPDWYGEQLREAAKLSAENQPEPAVTKHLIEALVALRRQHANEADAASSNRLKAVATAVVDNLRTLGMRSVATCHEFISRGETSPAVLEIVDVPNAGASVQAQMAAIFEAAADGRKAPATHVKPSKADYELLVAQLSKLGWSEHDLKVFSNPTSLAAEPPARICQMVQDWFAAHLAIGDQGVQERLLAETLKTIFSG